MPDINNLSQIDDYRMDDPHFSNNSYFPLYNTQSKKTDKINLTNVLKYGLPRGINQENIQTILHTFAKYNGSINELAIKRSFAILTGMPFYYGDLYEKLHNEDTENIWIGMASGGSLCTWIISDFFPRWNDWSRMTVSLIAIPNDSSEYYLKTKEEMASYMEEVEAEGNNIFGRLSEYPWSYDFNLDQTVVNYLHIITAAEILGYPLCENGYYLTCNRKMSLFNLIPFEFLFKNHEENHLFWVDDTLNNGSVNFALTKYGACVKMDNTKKAYPIFVAYM